MKLVRSCPPMVIAGCFGAFVFLTFLSSLRAQTPTATPYARQMPPPLASVAPGSWTLVVLPDTQHYVAFWPDVFYRQTKWIAANQKSQDVRFVVQEGDVTNNNTPEQWTIAHHAMKILGDAGIPYAILPGNKDLGKNGSTQDRSTLMNDYFTAADFANNALVGYFEPGRMENSWHEFDTPTGKYLLLALEFGPRDEVLAWANRIVSDHPECKVIVVTHGYLYYDGFRQGDHPKQGANPKTNYGLGRFGSVNDGEDMWKKFVSLHSNIQLVLNGHCTGNGATRLESVGTQGNHIWQILANFQMGVKPDRGFGGGGFLRLMRFLPDGKTVEVKTYSPWYDQWLTSPDQEFQIQLQ